MGTCARLGADAGRYSFIVTDFHRLLLAGFTGALPGSLGLMNHPLELAAGPPDDIGVDPHQCGTHLRLVEVAERNGVRAKLIQRAEEIDFDWLGIPKTLGITAGASAPEILVREVVNALAARFTVTETVVEAAIESIEFKLPRGLAA